MANAPKDGDRPREQGLSCSPSGEEGETLAQQEGRFQKSVYPLNLFFPFPLLNFTDHKLE